MRQADACIVGMGAQTAIGRSAAATMAAVRAGISAAAEHPVYRARDREPMVVCRTSWLPPDLAGVERFVSLATSPALEALAGWPMLSLLRPIELFVGLPEKRPGRPAGLEMALAQRLSDRLRTESPIASVHVFPSGHASFFLALAEAKARIAAGVADLCLVGGVDSYLEPETLEWLEDGGQLHSYENSWGFIPGEGAAFCLLASARVAKDSSNQLSSLLAVAVSYEENRIKTETVCVARGLSDACDRTLSVLPAGAAVDQVICDVNGEPYRSDELSFVMARESRHFAAPGEFLAPADCWGDVGAASGSLFAALAISASRRGWAKGPLHLLWASSEGGQRGAALLEVAVARDPAH